MLIPLLGNIELLAIVKGALLFSPFYFFRVEFLNWSRKLTIALSLIAASLFILISPFSFSGWFLDYLLIWFTATTALGTFIKNISVQGVTIARATSFSFFFFFILINSMFRSELLKSYEQNGQEFKVFWRLDMVMANTHSMRIDQSWGLFEKTLFNGSIRWDECNRYEYNTEIDKLFTWDERSLRKRTNELDAILRSNVFNPAQVSRQLDSIKAELKKSSAITKDEPQRIYNIRYRSNCDSSLVMVNSLKKIGKEFKRETIFNFNDTAIVVSRFHIWPGNPDRKADDSLRYIFLEEVRYLSKYKPVKIWRRLATSNAQLSDTTAFQVMPFEEHPATEKSYGIEVNYTRKILNRN